jgi:class 3 adenylate cyclase/tetratricopeptide (TPR) repeat protein
MSEKRKLSTVLFADIAGYTSLMQTDEKQAMLFLNHFKELIEKIVPLHQGEIIQYYGDAVLLTFDSANGGVVCAIALQESFINLEIPIRVGIHLGDVIFKNDNVFGDGVNIASRIESMGIPGSILVSKAIRDQISNKSEFLLTSLGPFEFKNVEEPKEVFALANAGLSVPRRDQIKGKLKETRSSRPTWLVPLIGLVAVGILMVGYNFLSKNNAQPLLESEFGIESRIAVFPFDVKGSDNITYLGQGIVDLISIQLDEIPSINSVDPNLLFSKLDDASTIARLPEKAAELSRSLGASEFILGSIIAVDNVLQLSATKYNAAGKKMATETSKGNKTDGLTKTIDELIKKLIASDLAEGGQELGSLAALMSNNFESLKLYLEGEQAFRLAKIDKARELFEQAAQIDSTFALAWMRALDSDWRLGSVTTYKQKWAQYKHTMPKKWQEYYDARELEREGDLNALAAYKNLNQRYGETYAFTYRIAEFLYHFNPSYGRSCTEAKPYLIKTLDLDGENLEAMLHLGEIAVMENDSVGLQVLIARTSKESPVYNGLKINEFLFKDTVTDADLMAYPGGVRSLLFPKENEVIDFTIYERMLELNPSPFWANFKDVMKYGMSGKDEALYTVYIDMAKFGNYAGFQMDQYQRCLPATLMADLNYLPLSTYYEEYYQDTKDRDTPWEIYAAIKYALALNKNTEAKDLKVKLQSLATTPKREKMVKYYDYSIKAFEARVDGNNDLALAYIDSAYQSPFGYWEIQSSCFDKTIMAANIYAEQGNFEKAISHFGHVNIIMGYELVRSYGAYKKSQWYEEIGDTENALAKCNLFLESYKDCDEKYRPWVEEVKERKDRLIDAMN